MTNIKNDGFIEVIKEPKGNEISYYNKPIQNKIPSGVLDLNQIFSEIKSPRYKKVTDELRAIKNKSKAGEFKNTKFDYVTFGGIFSKRGENFLIEPSHYFTIDVDNIGENLMNLRQAIIDDQELCPQMVFISPRGNGLKVIVKIDSNLIQYQAKGRKMEILWDAVNSYFSVHYADFITPSEKNEYIDSTGKDISRACYLCHDPHVHFFPNDTGIIDNDFIQKYPSIIIKSVNNRSKRVTTNEITVNPSTNLRVLAKRHLKETDNHYPDLIKFVGAACTTGQSIEEVKEYITKHVNISTDSTHSDEDKLFRLVDDIYERYNTNSEEVITLDVRTIAYKILYGKYDKDAGMFVFSSLYRDGVLKMLHDAGFAKRKIGKNFVYIQANGCIIKEVTPENMRDYMISHVFCIEEKYSFIYKKQDYSIYPDNIREIFLRTSNDIFNKNWLEHIREHTVPVLKDKAHEMYFFLKNVLVTISKEGISTESWEDKTGFCIWAEQIIQRDFEIIEDYTQSHFYKFLRNVTNNEEDRFNSMVTGIGYLMHHSFKESEGQAVIFYDEEVTDIKTPQGGSGKGLIINAIKQVRNVTKIDGKHLDATNRFRWELIVPSTQLVWIDDVKPDFDFSMLFSNLTDGWTIERKNLPQFTIAPKDSPKTVICSNSIIKGGGSTYMRRQFVIELSNFYSKKIKTGNEKPIEQEHGCIFFGEKWMQQEWNMFFNLMFDCAYQFLNDGFIPYTPINVEVNRFRQSTNEDFATWAEEQNFKPNVEYNTKQFCGDFIALYYGDSFAIGQRTFSDWLKKYATYKGWEHVSKSSNNVSKFIFIEK